MDAPKPRVFPVEDFGSAFPCFFAEGAGFSQTDIMLAGNAAMRHIGEDAAFMPLRGADRQYALFLMAAHILVLRKKANSDVADGNVPVGGMPFKSTVGSVSVENTKPNTFTTDDWSYWLSQTAYGQELLALLDAQAPIGIYLNGRRDSVRVLS